MMRDCIRKKIDDGVIDKKNGQKMLDLYDGFVTAAGDVAKGEADFIAKLEHDAFVAKKKAVRNVEAFNRLNKRVEDFKGDYSKAAESLIYADGNGGANFYTLAESIKANAFRKMKAGLEKFQPTIMGGKNRNFDMNADDFVRELFGTSTGNADMAAMAKAWKEVAESLRLRFNDAGGDIPYMKDWHLPQHHDQGQIVKAGFQKWRDDIDGLLDWDKMVDFETGLPMDQMKKEAFLADVYNTLATDGMNKVDLDKARAGAGTSVANRHREHRALIFKDADGWLAYSREYGGNNPVNAVIGYIERNAREIAQMEIFGANPATLKSIIDNHLGAADAQSPKLLSRQKAFNNLWREAFGGDETGRSLLLAKTGSFLRGWEAASKLGSAFISSFTDPTNAALIAAVDGLDVARYAREMARMATKEGRKFAEDIGLLCDAASRIIKDEYGDIKNRFDFSLGQRLNRAVMKASLLDGWTRIGQKAFQLDMSNFLAKVALNEGGNARFAKLLERYGINDADLKRIADIGITDFEGLKYVNLAKIGETDVPLYEKLQNMFITERDAAIINTNMKASAILHQGTQAGTVVGELNRMAVMFKTFPVTHMLVHYQRFMREENLMNKAMYGLYLVGAMTLIGGVALQSKEILKGRTPRPIDGRFAKAALLQGGGLGIFGDFLFSDVSRSGAGGWGTYLGPVGELGSDLFRLAVQTPRDVAAGEEAHYGTQIVNMLGKHVPGSSLWYARLAYERMVLDQFKQLADPKANRYFHQMERRLRRDYGQKFWWKPGEATPDL